MWAIEQLLQHLLGMLLLSTTGVSATIREQ
jgi:hypothetical protein